MKERIQNIWQTQKQANDDTIMRCDYLDADIPHLRCAIAYFSMLQKIAFVLELNNNTNNKQDYLKRFKGVEIMIIPNTDKTLLCIVLQETMLEEIFTLLITDIVEALIPIETEKEAITTIHIKINEWRRLFDKVSSEGLTHEQQIGLFGELSFIKILLENGIDKIQVVNAWLGPRGANQDFDFQGIAIEIKTTTANNPVLKISNEFQLDDSTLQSLYLVLFQLKTTSNKQKNLPNLIGELRVTLQNDSLVLKNFNNRITQIGYFDEHYEYYENQAFELRETTIFEIKDIFPRLIPNNLPFQALHKVSYSIHLGDCQDFIIDISTLINDIKNG